MRLRLLALLAAFAGHFFAALSAQAGSPAFEAAFQRVFKAPDDPELNRAFAAAAETEGELRLAYAALERAVRARPDDPGLQQEYARLRALLLPPKTLVNWDVGAAFASNPRQSSGAPARLNGAGAVDVQAAPPIVRSGLFDAGIAIGDERTFGSTRWRTISFARAHYASAAQELSNIRIGAWTGPMLLITPQTQLHVGFGGSLQWMEDSRRRNEASVKLQMITPMHGYSQIFDVQAGFLSGRPEPKLRVGDRDSTFLDATPAAASGFFAQASALLTRDAGLRKGDKFYIQPSLMYFRPHETTYIDPEPLEGFQFQEARFRAENLTAGLRLTYAVPLQEDRVIGTVGFGVFKSWSLAGDISVGLDLNRIVNEPEFPRRSLRIEPAAGLVFPNLIARDVDFRIDYRFEKSFSTKRDFEFDNHVAGARIVGRF